MKLRDYIIKRLILLIPVMFGVSIMSFVLSMSIGDPIASYVGEEAEKLGERELEELRTKLGLDRPIHEQYIRYLQRLATGDLGVSSTFNPPKPVIDVILERFPATAELSIFSLIMAVIIGIPLGIISAVKKDKAPDQVSRITALSGVSMPIFWLGLMLQVILFNLNQIFEDSNLGISFPFDERYNVNDYTGEPKTILRGFLQPTGFRLIDTLLYFPADKPLLDSGLYSLELFIDSAIHILPPAFCLAWVTMALITRMTRMAMIETMRQDYILLAKSKGLTERVIIYRHALKNAIIPTLTVAGLSLAGLLTGTVLTETVFSWPGLGQWAVAAVSFLDISAIQGFVLIAAIIYVLSNLIVDILYAVVDPRIRYD